MKNQPPLVLLLLLVILTACQSPENNLENEFPKLSGPYLGQILPDTIPQLFAPGIVGTGIFTRDIAISPAGDELLYCVALGNYAITTILESKLENGFWTKPKAVPFAEDGKIFDFEPAFSPDGNRIFFLSTRSGGDEEAGDQDIWYVERTESGWGEAINPGSPLNSDGGEFFPSLTRDGFIYFTHNDAGSGLNEIFRSKIFPDSIGTPVKLPPQVNCGINRFNAFVSIDHDYVIVPAVGMEDAYDQADYYIVYRSEDDRWSEPINLGPAINKDNTRGWSPYVTRDQQYFFFMSNKSGDIEKEELTYDNILEKHKASGNGNSDIYWVKAEFIKKLKTEAIFN